MSPGAHRGTRAGSCPRSWPVSGRLVPELNLLEDSLNESEQRGPEQAAHVPGGRRSAAASAPRRTLALTALSGQPERIRASGVAGRALFDRVGRRLVLTRRGQHARAALRPHARRARQRPPARGERRARGARARALRTSSRARRAPPSPGFLARFAAARPKVQVKLLLRRASRSCASCCSRYQSSTFALALVPRSRSARADPLAIAPVPPGARALVAREPLAREPRRRRAVNRRSFASSTTTSRAR